VFRTMDSHHEGISIEMGELFPRPKSLEIIIFRHPKPEHKSWLTQNPERRSGTRAPILLRQFLQTMNNLAPAMPTTFAVAKCC